MAGLMAMSVDLGFNNLIVLSGVIEKILGNKRLLVYMKL